MNSEKYLISEDIDNKKVINIETHSQVVKLLKLLLPSFAAVLACSVIMWPHLKPKQSLLNTDIENIKKSSIEAMEITKPNFQSMDKKNNPFNITAVKAFEKSDSVVIIEKPKGDFSLNDNDTVMFNAENGEYNTKDETLYFTDNVSMFLNNGYSLITDKVNVDIKSKYIESNAPVFIKGDAREIKGSKIIVKNNGNNIIIKGKVNMTLKDGKYDF